MTAETAENTHVVTWQDIETDCRALADMLKKTGPLLGLIAVARGGLVPTAMLANLLDIRNVKSVAVTSFFGRRQVTAEMLGSVDEIKEGEGWVFIDDMADTGQTAKLIRRRYPKAKFAVVYAKPDGQAYTDYFVKLLRQEMWVVYPWEGEL